MIGLPYGEENYDNKS